MSSSIGLFGGSNGPSSARGAGCGVGEAYGTDPSPMYGRYGNFCRYIVDIPMHRARSKCRSRVRVLAPTTEQVPVFFRESVYRPYDAVSGLYRLALPEREPHIPYQYQTFLTSRGTSFQCPLTWGIYCISRLSYLLDVYSFQKRVYYRI